jgi:hypothetical protein
MKKAIFAAFCIVLIFFFGCAKPPDQNAKMRASLADAAKVFNTHDFAKYATYYSDDFWWDPVGSKTRINRTDFIAMLAAMPKDDPAQYHFQAMTFVAGSHGFFDGCSFVSTNPTTKLPYRTFHADIVDFKDGKVSTMTTFSDGAAEDVALGLIEPPVPAPPLPGRRVWPTVDPVATKMKPVEAQKESLVQWNSHDPSSTAKMLSKDAQIQFSILYDPVARDAYMGWLDSMFKSFPDLSLTEAYTYDLGGGWVASEVKMAGTNSGPYMGHAATGKPVSLRAAYLGHYDTDGLATSLKLYFNSRAILSQLGFEPAKVPIPPYMRASK